MTKLSREEWIKEQEERRLPEKDTENSVEIVPQPSFQIVPKKRGPGRPRKERHLVVDLTMKDIVIDSQGTDGTKGTGGSSGTGLKIPTPNTSPPSTSKPRRDWLHPALFLRIYRYVFGSILS